jgi:hypothetical protein
MGMATFIVQRQKAEAEAKNKQAEQVVEAKQEEKPKQPRKSKQEK